jgi:hypothetical protein
MTIVSLAISRPVATARAIHDSNDDSMNARAKRIERDDAKCRRVCLLTMLAEGQT